MSLPDNNLTESRLSLDEFVEQNRDKLRANFSSFLKPLLDVVHSLHKQGTIHGAIHPEALRFKRNGEFDSEFLLSKRRNSGSPVKFWLPFPYQAPEVLESGGEDSRTDCYAIGALIHYVVTGFPPPSISQRGCQDVQFPSSFYVHWEPAVIAAAVRCLRLSKDQRFKDAQELWCALTQEKLNESSQFIPVASKSLVSICERTADTYGNCGGGPADKFVTVPAPFSGVVGGAARNSAPQIQDAKSAPATLPVKLHIRERLPNASVGKPFRQSLRELFGEQSHRVAAITITLPENSGLVFNEFESVVHGTPTTAGEVKLVLSYHLSDSQPGRPALTHTVCLTVNPDPSSLWKNIASDANGAFAKPDSDNASLVTPDLTALAASLRGRSHAHEGKYRDDDFGMQFIANTGWHIFIAADGAGSAKFSRRGSQIACKAALAELDKNLSTTNALDAALAKIGIDAVDGDLEKLRRVSANLLMPAAYKAFSAIHQQAKESQATLRDFGTTFIVVIARQFTGRWFFAAFAIGDGGAGVFLTDGKVQLLTQPDSGDFAGQTVFLTNQQVFTDSEALLARTNAAFCADFKFLALMTDGITDPIFQSDANFASASVWEMWEKDLAKVVNLDAPVSGMEKALLNYLNFASPGNHDDRTLVIAVPKRVTA